MKAKSRSVILSGTLAIGHAMLGYISPLHFLFYFIYFLVVLGMDCSQVCLHGGKGATQLAERIH